MSDKTDINILTTTAITYATATKPETKRAIAVLAAIDLIKADISCSTTGSKLSSHLDGLSNFADAIEEALNKK